MDKDRLLKLADLLEADANNPTGAKFDLSTWATQEQRGYFPARLKILDCNTTACAIGLACLSGAFKADGLRWKSKREDNNIEPIYGVREGFDAVDDFFEISRKESHFLFADYSYSEDYRTGAEGEMAVADRIRGLVAGTEHPPARLLGVTVGAEFGNKGNN